MTALEAPSRRPVRRVGLALILSATLAFLCCCGGLTASFFADSSADADTLLSAEFGCGEQGALDPDGKLPRVQGFSATQIRNAAIIVNVGAKLDVPKRGWVIAVATAIQESSLRNLPHLGEKNDHDSVGLFQQRPSQGWGSPEELQDPKIAAEKFYTKLLKVPGWRDMPLTEAAQAVQISAYPDAYAKHEPAAIRIVNRLTGGAARAAAGSAAPRCAAPGEITAAGWTAPVHGNVTSEFRSASRPNHHGIDVGGRRGDPIFAAAAGLVITAACDGDSTGQRCRREGSPSTPGCGWYVKIQHDGGIRTMYCHMQHRPPVRVGERVAVGQQIGVVGNTGRSSGPHLHFEVHDPRAGGPVEPIQFLRERGVVLGEKG